MKYLLLLVALFFNAFANIFVKLSSFEKLSFFSWKFFVGIGFFGLALIFYTLALKSWKLSVAYPIMTGGGFLIVSLFSVMVLKEHVSVPMVFGMLMIVGGIWLIGYFS